MESVKDILKFCNAAVFYDYTNIGITCELKQIQKCIFNSLYKTIPDSRILVSLCKIDEKNSKINKNDIRNIPENIHDLRENIV